MLEFVGNRGVVKMMWVRNWWVGDLIVGNENMYVFISFITTQVRRVH